MNRLALGDECCWSGVLFGVGQRQASDFAEDADAFANVFDRDFDNGANVVVEVLVEPVDSDLVNLGGNHPVACTRVAVVPAGELANIASESNPIRASGAIRITTRPGLSRCATKASCALGFPGRTLAARTG